MDVNQLLIQYGIDVNCKNINGDKALTELCGYYEYENLIDVKFFNLKWIQRRYTT
jgi:hypothetical protein